MSRTLRYSLCMLGLLGFGLLPRVGGAESKPPAKKVEDKTKPKQLAVEPLSPIPWMRSTPKTPAKAAPAAVHKVVKSRKQPLKASKKHVKVRALFGSGDAPQLDP